MQHLLTRNGRKLCFIISIHSHNMPAAIVIGASAGIGREVARELAGHGYSLGLVARRVPLLEELHRELPVRSFIRNIDVTRTEEARRLLDELIREMGGADLIVISAGVIFQDPGWEQEMETISLNVAGFAAMFNDAFTYFCRRGAGHIVGISSVAAVRGGHGSPVYHASKAFTSSLMHGYRLKARRMGLKIHITDIRPGHVATAMMLGQKGAFWVVPAGEAARQIVNAILHRRKHAYITKRWRLIAWLMRLIPDWLYYRIEM
jgi:short-subunit dehydrogenase